MSFRGQKTFISHSKIAIPADDLHVYKVNPGRGNHTESAYHNDRKLCSTRRENSSPGRRYGCTNIADIVTPVGLFSPPPLKNWP
ncbi:hypothetical protein Taro_039789 [Colocasia esculenta]|uniref:Uncharacterized protein n=1 Tax=Colocasia esculenta TaxID=4460 RepID=A0A843WGS5_COLES|nr:hypothetical protein [Colocasia esculenta]